MPVLKQAMIEVVVYDFAALAQQTTLWRTMPLHVADQHALPSHPQRRLTQHIGRYFCRKQLAAMLQVDPATLIFSHTPHGKPRLAAYPQLGFNQSHSQTMYALASSLTYADIGVDVEDKHRTMRTVPLAQRNLTPAEYQRFELLAVAEQRVYWLKMWTIKEAVLKAAGLGIRLNLSELDTRLLHLDQSRGTLEHPRIGRWHYACYELSQHVLSVSWSAHCGDLAYARIMLSELENIHG